MVLINSMWGVIMRERKEINIRMGDQIRMVREQAGLTQEQFGALVSLGPKNVSDIERGIAGISVSTLKRICERMHVSSDRILFGEREFNETDHLVERLDRLSGWDYVLLESFLNQVFYLFGMLRK